jgi:prophage antirepressor-like protein
MVVVCKLCSSQFSRKDNLKKHLRERRCKVTIDLYEFHEKLNDNVIKKAELEVQENPVQEPNIQDQNVTIVQESNEVNLLVKTFEQNNITIYGTFDKPLFKAKDIGDLLGISDINSTIRDFTNKQKGMHNMHTLGGKQETTMLTEQGLYKVILRSRKPIAVKFQDWVCEVIEEIRKTGEYKSKIKKSNELFIQQYNGKSVNYIANVQEKDGYIIKKYGQTTGNLYERLKAHQKQYGKNFHFTNIIECDNIQELEKRIQTHELLKERHIKSYNGKLTKELIKLDNTFTEKDLMKIIDEIKDTLDNTINLKLEQEKTKQIELQEQTKQIELQEQTKQKELELEIKKMEFEMMKLQFLK